MREVRVYSREFRMLVVQRIVNGERVPALATELGIHRKLLYQWMRQVNDGGESNLKQRGRPRKVDEGGGPATTPRVETAERTVVKQQQIIEFLRQVVSQCGKSVPSQRAWREAVYQAIESHLLQQPALSVETMCELLGVARCGYYRYLRQRHIVSPTTWNG